MPAQKAGRKAAKKAVRKGGRPVNSCPETPFAFFDGVNGWAKKMRKWAAEVDACYASDCGSASRRTQLLALCAEFNAWSKKAQAWANKVEDCYQLNCVGAGSPPGHTAPPPPPF